ncbi:MAG: hypothetical protein JJU15_06305 [Pararhodobacter sp.]|nr:hypothetical protein [Pararhodobacter sp.]
MPDQAHSDRVDSARMRAILTLAAAVAFIALSYAAPDFQGYSTDQMPQAEPRPPVQPAGYAFALWGVIYLWLLISAGFGLLQRAENRQWNRHRWALIGSMLLGAGWIWLALVSPIAATISIFAMLALALLALRRTPSQDFWLLRAPVGLYAGWLTAAAFVSLGAVVAGYGLIGGQAAALVMIVLAAAVAAWVMLRLKPVGSYAIGAGWGLTGIAVANAGRHAEVMVLAVLCAALLAFLWWRERSRA